MTSVTTRSQVTPVHIHCCVPDVNVSFSAGEFGKSIAIYYAPAFSYINVIKILSPFSKKTGFDSVAPTPSS
jgi:hypothetical protein